jgi:hypothetical protein
MFRSAPIWLNEMLVSVIKFFVGLFPFICVISAATLIYIIIREIKNKRVLSYNIKKRDILILLGCFFAACIGLFLFYMPQAVIPGNFTFDEISILIESPALRQERITVSDKEGVNVFKEMFRGFKCRRSFDSGRTTINSEVVFIDLTVFDGYKRFPLHFIASQQGLRRYTAGNTDFIYIIEDDENILLDRVFEYARKYAEAAKVGSEIPNKENAITGFAWEIINRDIANYELNPEVKIVDSKITRLELLETFDTLAETPIHVYALEYRLLPEDLSKVVLAGGMDYDEEGWLKETCSMGSPLMVISEDNGEAELIGILWTGEGGGRTEREAEIKAMLERTASENPELSDRRRSDILSDNSIDYNGDNVYETLVVEMTGGKQFEDTAPGPFQGWNWQGKFVVRLIDSEENIISELDLNRAFNGEELIFNEPFVIEFDDFNNDGNIDFAIGQYASSNGNTYRLFTIKDSKIEVLPVITSGIFSSMGMGRYTIRFEKSSEGGFFNSYYDNIRGKLIKQHFLWDGSQFIVESSSEE